MPWRKVPVLRKVAGSVSVLAGVAFLLPRTNNIHPGLESKGVAFVFVTGMLVHEGPERIKELMDIGANFSKENGELMLGKEGGHSRNRIIHSNDLTGKEIERALLNKIAKNGNIKIYEYYFAIDLLTEKNLKRKIKNNK